MSDTVAILVNNPCDFDSRVLKGASTIAKAGFNVVILARAGNGLPSFEEQEDFRIRRIAWSSAKDVVKATLGRWVRGVPFRPDERIKPDNSCPVEHQHDVSRLSQVPAVFKPLKRLLGRHVREPLIHYEHASACLAALIEEAPKICHAHDLDTLMTALLAKRALGPENLSVVYDSHEIACEEYGDMAYMARAWRIFQERRWIKGADAIIAAWPGVSDYFYAHYGRRVDAIVLNAPCIGVPVKAKPIASFVKMAPGEKLVVFIGAIRHDRGVFVLLVALSLVDNWHLAFIGPSNPVIERELTKRAIELDVSDRVHLMGLVPFDQVVNAVASADASVLLNENTSMNFDLALPNKLFESVLAGIPIVVGGLSAPSQFVVEQKVGFVVDQQDPKSIAAALNKIMADPGAMRPSPERLAVLRETFGWGAQEAKLLDVYDGIRARFSV